MHPRTVAAVLLLACEFAAAGENPAPQPGPPERAGTPKPLSGDEATDSNAGERAKLDALLDKLGAEDFATRKAAHEALVGLGRKAHARVIERAKDVNAAIAQGAREAAEQIEWGKGRARLAEVQKKLPEHAMAAIQNERLAKWFPEHRFFSFDAGMGTYRFKCAISKFEDELVTLREDNPWGRPDAKEVESWSNEKIENITLKGVTAVASASKVKLAGEDDAADFFRTLLPLFYAIYEDNVTAKKADGGYLIAYNKSCYLIRLNKDHVFESIQRAPAPAEIKK